MLEKKANYQTLIKVCDNGVCYHDKEYFEKRTFSEIDELLRKKVESLKKQGFDIFSKTIIFKGFVR
jgi:hypothetical protein